MKNIDLLLLQKYTQTVLLQKYMEDCYEQADTVSRIADDPETSCLWKRLLNGSGSLIMPQRIIRNITQGARCVMKKHERHFSGNRKRMMSGGSS